MTSTLKHGDIRIDNSCDLSENERAWIEFIRLCSQGRDPAPTLQRVQKLRLLLNPGLEHSQPASRDPDGSLPGSVCISNFFDAHL